MISRSVDFAKAVFYAASRGAERILPPMALWLLLWPLTEVVAARHAQRSRDRVPAARLPLPPASERSGTWKRWRYFSRLQRHWWLLGWLDRLAEAKWQRRLDVHGLERLTAALAERPVIIATVHTTSIVVLPAWLRSLDIPIGAVPLAPVWFSSSGLQRKVALADQLGNFVTFRPTSPRAMVEFLTLGHAIVLAADDVGGRTMTVPWAGGSMNVSTDIFRLARMTGAAVVPVIMFSTGRWRYEATICEPVPQDLVVAADTTAAAVYLAERLVPLAVARPEQATGILVDSIR